MPTRPVVTRAVTALAPALAAALAVTAATRPAAADPAAMVETDPATFALGGFAAHLRVRPGPRHLVVGAGAYALDLPALLVDARAANRDAGWQVRLTGAAGFVDHYLAAAPRGWFVGVEVAVQRYRYRNDDVPGMEAATVDLLVMPRAGYQWRPFAAGFYVLPWLGLGYAAEVAGDRRVGDREYAASPVVPYAAVHLGWEL
ncbi:MAG: hypothetical protein H6709_24305 [Kofleriaceae bacterium]|nr:hypothetical protein [Kofleriaceae bacterium]MCB9575212.1 hypothetical protein [Kofleriaceae bacterium]